MTTTEAIWTRLEIHGKRLEAQTLGDLFSSDSGRFGRMSAQFEDILFDYSRENLDSEVMDDLVNLARLSGIESRREAMFRGEKINLTEHRSVLHMALRGSCEDVCDEQGSVYNRIDEVKDRFLDFAESVRQGRKLSLSDEKFTDVINIGIGGSDLGPAMVTQALTPWHDGPKLHYISNVDGSHILETLDKLNPKTTLIIVASKTFTTSETMLNFETAMAWLKNALGKEVGKHLVAISTNLERTRSCGIDDEHVFGFWDWVGGRYSVWSSIGLPIAIATGKATFLEFLAGARQVDQHFETAPIEENVPILAAMIGIWRRNILRCPTVAMIPYDQHLSRLPAYIQQLDMESNGKSVGMDGQAVSRATGPVIWGEAGTNAQHSFFQYIHQGTDTVPVDFLVAANPSVKSNSSDSEKHHIALMCNALAQAQALAFGRSETHVRSDLKNAGASNDEIDCLAPHRTFAGNRPSSLYVYKQLTPKTLGKLIALFEHKVFVQGVVWNINSFDQWGVELGKKLANELNAVFEGRANANSLDQSTAGVMEYIHSLRKSD